MDGGKGEQMDYSLEPTKRTSPVDTLTLVQ